jgi:peroxiredoxin (alkyl hydroperoxide reductase subunit C)
MPTGTPPVPRPASAAFVGRPAPAFRAPAYVAGEIRDVSLSDYRGTWVVLFFYPLDFTFVCPTELRAFARREADFAEEDCHVLAASTDSVHAHKAWFERDLPDVRYPVLSDPTHRLARDYGVLVEDEGIALRGTFLIDPEGILRYAVVSDLNLGRSTDETLRVLRAAKTGALCPADWSPGTPTLVG